MPAFKTSVPIAGGKRKSIQSRLEKLIERQLDLPLNAEPTTEGGVIEKNFELFAMVPLSRLDDAGVVDLLQNYGNPEIAVRLQAPGTETFTLRSMEDLLTCRSKTAHMMQKN